MCGGRCYLYQQLQDLNEGDNNSTTFKITRLSTFVLYVAPKWSAFSATAQALSCDKKKHFTYRALLDRLFNQTPFIPPEQAAQFPYLF